MRRARLALLALAFALPADADTLVLLDGDRISGRVEGSTTRRFRLRTPYGLLVIPRDKVERVLRDDGREELVSARPAPAPAPAPPPPPPPVRLAVSLKGDTFWQAWDPKSAPADPTLRLEVRVDQVTVASYSDLNLDPEDLPKAVVNSFVFAPERLVVRVTQGGSAAPPALSAGEIRLALELPADLAGDRALELAYQVNDGTSAEPQWRDVVSAGHRVRFAAGQLAAVRMQQSRGTMEFARRTMRNVETFTATLEDAPAAP
jgi:hypothetical protein